MNILSSGVGNYIMSEGRKYSYFGGNNYLGLANHPEVREAAIRAIEKYGVNFSASRRTTGTADLHLELEKKLAAFKGVEDAVVFASGYQGNSILLEVLKPRYTAVFMDQLAHPSITGSVSRDIANVQYYKHCDAGHLEDLLTLHPGSNPLVITDGIFALTGEITPLDRIFPVVEQYNGIMIVDDAHSTGLLGQKGRGTPDHFNLPDNGNIFQTETMSKALGGYGGFIAGRMELTELIREKSAIYQASTALPPPIVAAGLASLKIIQENPEMRIKLLKMAGELRKRITELGFQTTPDNTPIIPVMLSELIKAKELSLFMESNGIVVPFINYPVKQEKYLLRIAVSSSHTYDQIEDLVENLIKWKDKYGTH